VTQQNAALVEESATAAAALEDQASRLKQSVAVFNIGKEFVVQAVNVSTAAKNLRSGTPKALAPAGARSTDDNWETFNPCGRRKAAHENGATGSTVATAVSQFKQFVAG